MSSPPSPAPEPDQNQIHLTGPIGVMLHQCSSCRYVSTHKQNVERHVATRCPGARVLSGELQMEVVGRGGTVNTITGDHNHTTTVNGDHITNINIIIPVGTPEETLQRPEECSDPSQLRRG